MSLEAEKAPAIPGQRTNLVKALSIVSPNGMRIAMGEETLEVRRWSPNISAREDLLIVENDRFLRQDGDEDQDGRAVAIVRVAKVRPFIESDVPAACASFLEEGWLASELIDIRPVRSSEKILAARGLFEASEKFRSLA